MAASAVVSGQTSTGSLITRELEKQAEERKQMKAESMACALPNREVDWNGIDWRKVNRNVSRLQARIVKATQEGRKGKVKALQRLLTRSYSGKVLAVRRVTENRGKKTPGVDGETWDNPAKKAAAVENLRQRGYRPKPLRRVYILKSDGKRQRPLGIPTMKDRAMQALYLLALDPVAETTADPNSYGFRKGRSTMDAIQQCYTVLCRKETSPEWILEGDIKACYDNLSHEWLLAKIPIEKAILSKWLKAGYLEKHILHPTEAGTPQGGIISPTLMNMALDGLEKELLSQFRQYAGRSKGSTTGVNYVRYADDWIVTCRTRTMLEEQVLPYIERYLAERGLRLSQEKTCITHIDEGFDFLGQTIRRYNGKVIVQPAKKSIKKIVAKVRYVIKTHKMAKAGNLIQLINPLIRGWCNYHRYSCASKVFQKVDHDIFWMLWRWAKRRHTNKGKRWIRKKYFKTVGGQNWVFSGEAEARKGEARTRHLLYASSIHMRRYVKIRMHANPYDPAWEMYFENRIRFKMKGSLKGNRKFTHIWRSQDGICPVCQQLLDPETGWDMHHIVWRSHGGGDTAANLQMLHPACHKQIHACEYSVV